MTRAFRMYVRGVGVGDFTVRDATADRIVIGCHTLTRAECDAFAVSHGWVALDDARDVDATRAILAEVEQHA